jgi:hypothetical protein
MRRAGKSQQIGYSATTSQPHDLAAVRMVNG